LAQNKENEIRRGGEIKEDAEFLWGWATAAGKLRAKRRAEIVIRELIGRKSIRVLEIGCGTGVFTDYFCKEGFDLCGIDISVDLVKKLKSKCYNNARLNLCAADVENLPFPSNSFDAVVGICVLHHLNVEPALREIRRVVKTDGIILFSEPNMMNPQLMLQKNIKLLRKIRALGENEDETAFFRWQIKKIMHGLGYREISVFPFDFLHPWTPRAAIALVQKLGFCLEKTPLLKEISGSLFIRAIK